MGARAHGMGYSSACLEDVWSMTNNVAALAKVKTSSAAFSYHSLPSFTPFDRMSGIIALPLFGGVAGGSVFRFGDDLYNEQILSLGFANTFGLASLGFNLNYIQYRAEGLESVGAFTASFGGLATITSQLSFGAYIMNINQPVINELTRERIPTRLTAGFGLKISDKVFVASEVEKDLQQAPVVKGGFEYRPFGKIAFRTGFNLQPQAAFFGLGFKVRKFDLDYALQSNRAVGWSHEASITCQYKKR